MQITTVDNFSRVFRCQEADVVFDNFQAPIHSYKMPNDSCIQHCLKFSAN